MSTSNQDVSMIYNSAWKERWDIFKDVICKTESQLAEHLALDAADKDPKLFGEEQTTIVNQYLMQTVANCHDVLEKLLPFSDRLFARIQQDSDKLGHYPADFVMRTLIQQATIDLNTIQQAYNQRFGGDDSDGNGKDMDPQIQTLVLADSIAKWSIKPALEAGLLNIGAAPIRSEEPESQGLSIITYLNERVRIRILPYCDAILMGIPFSAFTKFEEVGGETIPTMSPDYLSIPHETGHVLYRHGMVNGELIQMLLSNQLAEQSSPKSQTFNSANWLEEIFADAYGCLVAGLMSFVGIQWMLTTGMPNHVQKGSDKHPIPALRPLIQLRILEQLYPALADISMKLAERWHAWVAKSWQIQEIETKIYEIEGSNISGDELLNQIDPLVNTVVAGLKEWVIKPTEMTDYWRQWMENAEEILSMQMDGNIVLPPIEKASQPTSRANVAYDNALHFIQEAPNLDVVVEKILFQRWSDEGPDGSPHIE